ncbi:hypothetical protein [Nitrosomonas sp. Nm58]|uniref:hypothetical protein n=1 Tax=Nitrosomonas sp. Nm58 TaxID=200126 RepID=UPI000897FFDB|nr:hypothetical protein [Nitrosomonas sp. Nm58]SDY98239.1 hypothetical protein SAMN05421754_103814 [Nitrosomonas sp. Nm58]
MTHHVLKVPAMTAIISFVPSDISTLPFLQRAEIDSVVCILPLLQYRIPAGFLSPADEYVEKGLELNIYLICNKAATYFFRETGNSMAGARAKFSRIADMANAYRPATRPHWRQVSCADAKVPFAGLVG